MTGNETILVLEYVNATPHLETSLEIALRLAAEGHRVDYRHIGDSMPFAEFWRPTLPTRLGPVLGDLSPHHAGMRMAEVEAKRKELPASFLNVPNIPKIFERIPSEHLRSVESLVDYRWQDMNIGVGVASSIVSFLRDSQPNLTEHQDLLQAITSSYQSAFEYSKRILEMSEYDAVVIFNGRYAVPRAIQDAAQLAGVKVFYHERGATMERYFFENWSPHNFRSRRKAIEEAWHQGLRQDKEGTVAAGQSFFERRRSGDGIGWKSFTNLQDGSWCGSSLFPPRRDGRLRVGYFSSSDDEYQSVGQLAPASIYFSQLNALNRLASLASDLDFDLIVRVHPHLQDKSAFERRRWEMNDTLAGARNVGIVPSGSRIPTYEIIDDVDLVIVWHSTVGVEATYWGKPVIALADAMYTGSIGAAFHPESDDELVALIESLPGTKVDRSTALPFGYYSTCSGDRFAYFEPASLFDGQFLSANLKIRTRRLRLYVRARTAVGRVARALLRRFRYGGR